jgi:SAM-dependent methyltransferase
MVTTASTQDMVEPEPTRPVAGRFQALRPDVREVPSWHRLAYVARALPARLEELMTELRVGPGSRVLDLGCAEMPYRRFFAAGTEVVGADLPGNPHASVTIQPDGSVPLPDEGFDALLSTQVLEHVEDPGTYLSECFRLLRPGGRLLLSTHGIMVYHPDPVDYWRWTCDGLRKAVMDAGFEVVRFEGVMGLAATGVQLMQDGVLPRVPQHLHPLVCWISQRIIGLLERLQGDEGRRINALVFAVVARKP